VENKTPKPVYRAHLKLQLWQVAMKFVETIYANTSGLPDHERFGLCAQLRRAAVSIPSNIAEGAARNSKRDLRRFTLMARGSLAEIETQILLCNNLGYNINLEELEQKIDRLYALLFGLLKSLDKQLATSP